MADKPALRATLEALKELKAEYYIGSQNAFNYLKAMRWYESLRQSAIAADPKDLVRQEISLRQIGRIMEGLRSVIYVTLKGIAAKESTPQAWSLDSPQVVWLPTDQKSDHVHEVIGRGLVYHWSFDYAWALDMFLRHVVSEGSDALNLPSNAAISLLSFLRTGVGAKTPFLNLRSTNEKLSLKQFAMRPQFRQSPKEDWDVSAWSQLVRDRKPGKKSIAILKQALDRNDAALAHPVLRSIELRDLANSLRVNIYKEAEMWTADKVAAEAWLYDEELWERASHEYVLGRIEIERRIVLNMVYGYRHMQLKMSHDDFFAWLIGKIQDRLQYGRNRLGQLRELNAPIVLQQYEEKSIEKTRYTLVALRQNKKWLIEFLSK